MIKQTAGSWKPNDRAAYFQAISNSDISTLKYTTWVLIAVNELKGAKADGLAKLFDNGYRVLLDSGVYNLAADHARKNKITHDAALMTPVKQLHGFDKLMSNWKRIVDNYGDKLWGYIELAISSKYSQPSFNG